MNLHPITKLIGPANIHPEKNHKTELSIEAALKQIVQFFSQKWQEGLKTLT